MKKHSPRQWKCRCVSGFLTSFLLVFHFSVAVNVFHLHLVRDVARCSWRRDVRRFICGQTVLTKLGFGLTLQLSPESSQL